VSLATGPAPLSRPGPTAQDARRMRTACLPSVASASTGRSYWRLTVAASWPRASSLWSQIRPPPAWSAGVRYGRYRAPALSVVYRAGAVASCRVTRGGGEEFGPAPACV